jgi:molybdopterin-containing oxidoreductase family membrane subunit
MYSPSFVEVGIYIGTLGLFFTCFLLFCRFFPVIALAEVKHINRSSGSQAKDQEPKQEAAV